MGNEQVKIEKEFINSKQNNINTNAESELDNLLYKKKILDDILENKRYLLTEQQMAKINITLSNIIYQITNLINDSNNIYIDTDADINIRNNVDNKYKVQSPHKKLQLALKLFKINGHYTLDDLKLRYKKLAIITHPDKTGGNNSKFNLVTQCYEILKNNLLTMENDKQYFELKRNFQNSPYINANTNYQQNTDYESNEPKLNPTKVNPTLFNKYFEQNKMYDPNSVGYDEWLKSTEGEEEMNELNKLKGKVSIDKFNDIFKQQKAKYNKINNKQITEYIEPMALTSGNTAFTSILEEKIEDFTKAPETRTGIGYTDLKTAYSSAGLLIDPDSIQIPEYKNIEEYKKERSNISYTLNPEQQELLNRKIAREQYEEEMRIKKLQEHDMAIESHYNKIHMKMLGYAPKN